MKFLHVTDPHFVPLGEELHGLDPRQRLDTCVADINANHGDAELCVVTGDLAHRGEVEAYRSLRECLSPLRVPYHLLMGNHDRRESFREVFPDGLCDADGFVQSAVDTAAGRFLLLDTLEEGAHWGVFCERRTEWLRRQLDGSQGCPVYLFMHHPPFDIGLPCLDRIGLLGDGRARLADALAGHQNIRHLFFGHVHRPVTGSWQGIPFSTMRGTNHQVPFDFLAFEKVPKSHEPPAYAVAFLDENQTVVHFHDYLDRSVWREGAG